MREGEEEEMEKTKEAGKDEGLEVDEGHKE